MNFSCFGHLITALDPSEVITCFGILIDTPKATISIDPKKLCYLMECLGTQHKKYTTKKGLQSLLALLRDSTNGTV